MRPSRVSKAFFADRRLFKQILLAARQYKEVRESLQRLARSPLLRRLRRAEPLSLQAVQRGRQQHVHNKTNDLLISMGFEPLLSLPHLPSLTARQARGSGISAGAEGEVGLMLQGWKKDRRCAI